MRTLVMVVIAAACNRYVPPAEDIDGGDSGAAMLAVDVAGTDYGNVVVGATSTETRFTITNHGPDHTGPLTTLVDVADFSIKGDTCQGARLAAQTSCEIAVAFAPMASGAVHAAVKVTGSPGGTVSATLDGFGLTPGNLAASTPSHTFAAIHLGSQSSVFQIGVTNIGATDSGAVTAILSDGSQFALGGDGCSGMVLAPGASCTLGVQFAPAAVGSHTASLTLGASPGGSTAVSLGGTGTASIAVTPTGTGSGVVSSNPIGIDCGSTCTADFSSPAVTLIGAPAGGSTFLGWAGTCTGTGPCDLSLVANANVTARFEGAQMLTVAKTGDGTGFVTSDVAGINCGSDCSETYPYGQMVTLTAAVSGSSIFAGWSGGGCSGTGTCRVTLAQATTVTAAFTLNNYALNVALTGTGAGTVTSNPTGITCGTDCFESYPLNTMVTLTAAAAPGSTFAGWMGACTGTSTCQVTISAVTSVTAAFTATLYPVTVTRAGSGAGTVVSAPSGINCGSDCSESYTYATHVTLSATPSPGSTFAGWAGACSGTAMCQLDVMAPASVTTTFMLNPFVLTVAKTGSGTGTVTSNLAGINCGADCSESYPFGTMVTLTAAPIGTSTFGGWNGGGCSGTGTCTVTLAAATTVSATFLGRRTLTMQFDFAGGGGSFATMPPDVPLTCNGPPITQCTGAYVDTTQAALQTFPDPGGSVVFTGCDSITGMMVPTCHVLMDRDRTVTAKFSR